MKKGVFVLHVPIGNLSDERKIEKYIKSILRPIKKAIKQIKRSGYVVLVFPSHERTECSVEMHNF